MIKYLTLRNLLTIYLLYLVSNCYSQTNNKICFPVPTPYLFGGSTSNTVVNCFIFSKGNFIVGGYT
jgi:hypothetical protein